MPKKQMKGKRRSRRNRSNDNVITFSGTMGLTTSTASSSTYWMSPNQNMASAWLGFTPVIGGIFGPNANQLAHVYKQFRLTRLRLSLLPAAQFQIAAYTENVGYVTTTLTFPNVMQYPVTCVSSMIQSTTLYLNVPPRVLRSSQIKWFSTEDNPGTSSTDPSSDPNLSSHGLLVITDGGVSVNYVLDFTIQFRNPENSAQINPNPIRTQMFMSDAELNTLRALHLAIRGRSPTRSRPVCPGTDDDRELDQLEPPLKPQSSYTALVKLLHGLSVAGEEQLAK